MFPITLQVNKGDRVHMSANGKFEQQTTYNHDLPATLFSSLGTTFTDQFNGETAQTMETAFGDAFALLGTWGTSDPNKPRAFLNYMLFDENFDLIQLPGSSGFDQIDYGSGYDPSTELPSFVPFDNLELLIDNIPQNGYLYIWLSNETAGSKVWFDDLRIQRTHNQVTEETDYYPYGHILSQYKYDSKKSYRFGYQGEFAEEDEETGWNQFELRLYDGVVGRWLSVDPYNQYWSAYLGMGNSPINGVDPDGGLFGKWRAERYANKNGGIAAEGPDGKWGVWQDLSWMTDLGDGGYEGGVNSVLMKDFGYQGLGITGSDVIDFTNGFVNAVSSNHTFGYNRMDPSSAAFSNGQLAGDVASIGIGVAEIIGGAVIATGGTIGGIVTSPTGVGAVAGGAIAVEGVAIVVLGSATTGTAIGNILDNHGRVHAKGRFRGGKKGKRDSGLSGKPKEFKRWFHRQWKRPGDPDASYHEIEGAFNEWIRLGKPNGG